MKRWVFSGRVEPPNFVVSARAGGSVCFAGYSRLLDQWYLVANGTEEIMDDPEMLYLDEDYVRVNPRDLIKHPVLHASLGEKKPVQLQLFD